MTLALQVVNPALPQDQQQMMIMANFQDLENQTNAGQPQLLFSSIFGETQQVSSTSFVTLNNCTASITANGGLLHIDAVINLNLNDAVAAIGLFIDNELVITSVVSQPSGVSVGATTGSWAMPISWKGSLNSGQHSVQLKGAASSSSFTVNAKNTFAPISTMFIEQIGSGN